jgi:uncharacterized membrane protein
MGAPMFLFLAGVAVALAAGAHVRRGASVRAAAAAVRRRGWQILGLAFLFRLQAFVLSPGATLAGVLKVDILNVMGPAMVVAATLWGTTHRPWRRVLLLVACASAFTYLTPAVRTSHALSALPDWLEWYLRPPQGRSWFALFPWAGLLVAGTVVGELIDRSRGAADELRALRVMAVAGTAVIGFSLAATALPAPFGSTYFWTTSSSYFFLRIGLLTAALPAAWLWTRRLRPERFSPMLQFGHTSLFVYWIHVEMVYGILSWPLHRALPLWGALIAFLAFTGGMLWASVAKDQWVASRRASSVRATETIGSSGSA